MLKTLRLAFLLTLTLPLGSASAEPALTISGTVVDFHGRPAANVEMWLSAGPMVSLRLAGIFKNVARPVEIIARTTTDADGEFSIERSEAGREMVWARTWLVLWAHRPGSALATYTLGSDWPANAAPIMVRLKDASELPIEVSAPDGSPLAKAKVSPERLDNLRLPREVASRLASISDGAGRAVLHDLSPAGLELVRVETRDYGVQLVSLPAANANGNRKVVLAPVGTIHGRLTADDPRAIAAVPIWLATCLTAGDEAAGGGLAEVVSGADGQFEVPAIAAGTLSVSADVPGDLPFYCLIIADRPLKEATTMELAIKLDRAVRAEGVVRDRDSGAPLSGAAVLLYYWSPRSLARSDAQGRYGGFLLPGQVSPWIRRVPRGYYIPPGSRDSQTVHGGAAHVELKPLLLAKGVTLGGRVVDAAGKPVAAAEVEAHWEDASGEDGAAHAYSDRNGAYTLDGIEPQMQVKLTAWSIHGATAEAVSVPSETKGPIELVISPANGLRLEGRVVDVTGRPIAGAAVRVRSQRRIDNGRLDDEAYTCFEGRQRLHTDSEGRFRTPAALLPGLKYRAEATTGGMLPAVTVFTSKSTVFGDLVLREVPSLRAIDGRVVDRRGKPVAGLRVFQAGDGPRRTETTTDADGRFRLSGVYAGPVFLLVRGKGYPLQGLLYDSEGPAEFTARSDDEPTARQLKTLAEPLSLLQRREISLRLIEPMLSALKQGEVEAAKVWVLSTLAVLDRDRAVEFANLPIYSQLGLNLADETSYYAALALIAEDEAEALAVGESIATAHHRGRLYLAVCDRLPDAERARQA
ncbi:MAG TPA: carboxypeptidase regulatory-like domain-containing protein, partial [Pirellulales bacterium]